MALSPNDRLALYEDAGNALALVGLESSATLRRLRGHKGRILSVAFSPDGTHALSGGADRTARLWDLELFRPDWVAPLGAHAGAPFPACVPWAALHACAGKSAASPQRSSPLTTSPWTSVSR